MVNNFLISNTAIIIFGLLIVGCASFEPGQRLQDLNKPRQPTVKAAKEGLEISIEEFISSAKSQTMFDADLADAGVFPFLVRIENAGSERYTIRRVDLKSTVNGQALVQLPPREAARQAATREYAGKALGWTLATGPFAILLWPVTMGASAVHTHGVNKRIHQYFEASSYQDSLLPPKQTTLGFVFFKRPDNLSNLENLVVEAEALGDATGNKLFYKFEMPALALAK